MVYSVLLMHVELKLLLLHCFVADDASSEARVHDDYGVLTASIATKNETYVIEVNQEVI